MRALTRRRVLATVAATTVLAILPEPAEADYVDLGALTTIIGQMITEVAQFATQIGQFATMITNMVQMVAYMKQELSALKSGDLLALVSFIETAKMSYNQLTNGVQSMAYTIGAIDTDFHRLFPSSTSGSTAAQHTQYYQTWNNEVLAASQIAARQQTVLSTLDDQATQADKVLSQSENASGVVAQLQTVVEMLRLMQGQLITINQTLATASRVLADMAATEAANSALSQSKKQSSLAGYTNRGAPVSVPHTLP
jgi:P-type conjugative transfer protein TrbJ